MNGPLSVNHIMWVYLSSGNHRLLTTTYEQMLYRKLTHAVYIGFNTWYFVSGLLASVAHIVMAQCYIGYTNIVDSLLPKQLNLQYTYSYR